MRITVHVTPRSKRNSIEWQQETLRVHLTASPVDGAANEALIALLAERLGLPKRAITILHGATSRRKMLEITGITHQTFRTLLQSQ